MGKIFVNPEDVRDDSFELTRKLLETGFIPTIIYASMRGGSNVANPMSEYFKYLGLEVRYGTVIVSSYLKEWILQKICLTQAKQLVQL